MLYKLQQIVKVEFDECRGIFCLLFWMRIYDRKNISIK